IFLDDFVCQANANNTGYFFFEFFDEEWKDKTYGGVEGWWGLFTKDRKLKNLTIPDCAAPRQADANIFANLLAASFASSRGRPGAARTGAVAKDGLNWPSGSSPFCSEAGCCPVLVVAAPPRGVPSRGSDAPLEVN
ncbi:hypothetical protein HDZ31DRAFT_78720, partial [Schizophyllum fasciatum]